MTRDNEPPPHTSPPSLTHSLGLISPTGCVLSAGIARRHLTGNSRDHESTLKIHNPRTGWTADHGSSDDMLDKSNDQGKLLDHRQAYRLTYSPDFRSKAS